eukprot:TRINITY_DN17624_c0_g1_i1.p1 TRINITY_DN17624_c0_g1~~TRINITY_DN17624_c0_g1_i1.p1  ORF type:complete len:339 (-),score=70.69 TRINITY_DN17624_c0_g1_i1:32-985(-)
MATADDAASSSAASALAESPEAAADDGRSSDGEEEPPTGSPEVAGDTKPSAAESAAAEAAAKSASPGEQSPADSPALALGSPAESATAESPVTIAVSPGPRLDVLESPASLRSPTDALPAQRDVGASLPGGLNGIVGYTAIGDLRGVFARLDTQNAGRLDRVSARRFLRYAGWTVSDQELDAILAMSPMVGREASLSPTRASPKRRAPAANSGAGRDGWSFRELLVVLERARDAGVANGPSMEELRLALQEIAKPFTTINRDLLFSLREELGGLGEEELELALEWLEGVDMETMPCDDLAATMLGRMAVPPIAPPTC